MPLLPPLITHLPNAQQLYLSAGGATPTVPTITAEQFTATGTGPVSGFVVTTSDGNNFVADCNPNPSARSAFTINREGIPRWAIQTFIPESGGNLGSDLFIEGYSDAGVAFPTAYLNIQRSNGNVGIPDGDLGLGTGDLNIFAGNFVGAGASITKSATKCTIQPTDITKMMTINATKPFVPFVGVVGQNSWLFQPALGMFNSLVSYIDVNGLSIANVGSIPAQDATVLAMPLGTMIQIKMGGGEVNTCLIKVLGTDGDVTLFTMSSTTPNIVYSILKVASAGLTTDWIQVVWG